MDARLDQSRLGAVYQGLDNVLTSANFAQPFETTLLELAQRTLPGPSARPVSMRFYVLRIDEDIRTSSETGTVELVVNFLEKRGPGYALLLPHSETLESGGLDVTSNHAVLLTQSVYAAISGGQPRPYEIHMASGRILASATLDITDDQGFAKVDTAAVYSYHRPDGAPTQTLTVMIGNREAGTLLPNSYLALSWSDRRRKLALCARSTRQVCHSFVPDFAAATYLECSIPSAADETPTFRQVMTKKGVFYVKNSGRDAANPTFSSTQY